MSRRRYGYNGNMVEVKVLTLIVTGGGSPSFLVLEPIEERVSEGKSRVVPICVGGYEALGLGSVLEGTRFTRPMTHDLLLDARIGHVCPYNEERIVDEFKDFLEGVSPDDFNAD